MEWLNSLTDYFNGLGEQVYQILVNVQQTFDEMQMFFQVAQVYIIISGIALFVIFIMQIAAITVSSDARKETIALRNEIARLRTDLGIDDDLNEQPEKPEEELHTIG